MTASASNPIDPLVDPARATELDETRTMLLDLARSSGTHSLLIHVQSVRYAEELLFVHEALAETHTATGKSQLAQEENSLAEMARQLSLHHLDMLDRSLFRTKP